MTLVEVAIVVVACFLSMFLIIISCVNSFEKKINKYHRQELEAIDKLKKSIENKDPHFAWQYEEFGPCRCTLTPCGTEDDIPYPSHSEDKEGANV